DEAGDTAAAGKTAKSGALDDEAIRAVYKKRCAQCHGEEGDGQGPAAEFLYPKPRDFTLAVFKYKSTHADDEFPTDDDLLKTIRDGLNGTAMPGWKTILSEAEMRGLIKLIKEFGGWDEEEIEHTAIEEKEVVPTSPESIARGKVLFKKACEQCHGEEGRGNVTSGKRLKDDWGDRIWPRNLTRPESWRWTVTARDVFQRLSTGIRGTPMPEHTTTMKEKDRWDIANFVMTLRDRATPLARGETVIRGARLEGNLPESADDPKWLKARPMTFPMSPNVIKEGRLFTSLNDTVTVRVLFNDTEVAIRLDVDDRTYSVPGSKLEKQYRIDGIDPTHDAVAVQFPASIPQTSEKPWFRHGDKKHPVNMWYWRAPGEAPRADAMTLMLDATGPDAPPSPRQGYKELKANGVWKNGRWQVVMRRPLKTQDTTLDLQFEEGRYIPVAFANWDGVAGDKGSKHSFTSWYWLLLEPQTNMVLLYGKAGGAGLLAGLFFLLAVRRQKKHFV
ncbi:MAG TPA: c-type cytochrome, partial [Rhodobacteraceae bacterium]|nr:c-type cytochrome [Paracoccaceae bacterium]